MPMWRCPHCGTPQAETARCWVCRRSSTACATCQNFRRSVAAQLGYCGLDLKRLPLRGDEIRGCWEPAVALPEAPMTGVSKLAPAPLDPAEERTSVRKLEFVEVRTSTAKGRAKTAAGASRATLPVDDDEPPVTVVPAADPGWSLWGDAEI
ncbi:MAG: hypothetical protein ABI562_06970 [Chloroflexota bacterium]